MRGYYSSYKWKMAITCVNYTKNNSYIYMTYNLNDHLENYRGFRSGMIKKLNYDAELTAFIVQLSEIRVGTTTELNHVANTTIICKEVHLN